MSARAAWRLEQFGFARVFRYTPGKADWAAAGLPMEDSDASRPRAASAARRDVPTCRPDETASTVRTPLGASWPARVVVNEYRVVLGLLRRDRLEIRSPEATAETLTEEGPTTHRPSLPLEQAAEWMRQLHRRFSGAASDVRRRDAARAAGRRSVTVTAPGVYAAEAALDGPL